LRREYPEFQEREAEILNIGPDDAEAFRKYWEEHDMPFPGLADPKHVVAKRYGQPVRLLKLGRMPMQIIVDGDGVIVHRHEGNGMSDIPESSDLLAIIDRCKS
jgi:peroxiredoxin Q/BCP